MLILIVGEMEYWAASGRQMPRVASLEFCEFSAIDDKLLRDVAPDVVLSPLLSHGFDALDLAMLLEAYRYQGRYRVLAPPLPNPSLIIDEVRLLCPGLDFDLQYMPTERLPDLAQAPVNTRRPH